MPDILTKQYGPILRSTATRCPISWSPSSPGLRTRLACIKRSLGDGKAI
jgi:hypothetical protein